MVASPHAARADTPRRREDVKIAVVMPGYNAGRTLERTVSNIYHHRIDYPGFEFNRGARRKTGDLGPVSPPASEPRPAAGVRGSDSR